MKRRTLCAALCLAVLFGFASCGSKKKTPQPTVSSPAGQDEPSDAADFAQVPTDSSVKTLGVFSFSKHDHIMSTSDDRELARTEYPAVGLCEADAARYPALAQTLDGLNAEIAENALDRFRSIANGAAAGKAADPDGFAAYETTTRLFVRRADSAVLSLLFDVYTFAGGGQGTRFFFAKTYDTASGRELAPADMVTDVAVLAENAQQLLKSQNPQTEFFASLDLRTRFGNGGDGLCWFADDAGLTVVFNENDIAPGQEGPLAATVFYGAYPGLFRSGYAVRPVSRAVALPPDLPYFGDLTGDGKTDRLTVSCETDEYDEYIDTQSVLLNDTHSFEDVLAYSAEPVLLHTSDGMSFLYVQNLLDDDYRQITVYRFSNGKAEKVDTVPGGFGCAASDTDAGGLLPTGPDAFVLESRTELLSTAVGRRVCHVGKDGVPEAVDEWYTLAQPVALTLLRELRVETLGADGAQTGETTLPAGTKLVYFRTDAERFADLRTADGGEVRVQVGRADWGFTADGVDVRELFDGVIYAG